MQPYYEQDGITIYHGDCLEILPGLAFDVVVTDPPYGMGYASGWTGNGAIRNDHDHKTRDAMLALWGGPAVVFGRWDVERPKDTRAVLIWDKGDWPGMGDLKFPWGCSHEEIYVIGKGFTGRRAGTVLRDPRRPSGHAHYQNEKPVELMERLIVRCPPGTVCDPFSGSGSTLVAAAKCNRPCIGIELEERNCETAAGRLTQGVLRFT